METIKRTIKKDIVEHLYNGYGVVVYGARRVGKTTLVKEILAESSKKSLYINCDERVGQEVLSPYNSLELRKNIGEGIELVVIDEAQRIFDIGIKLKLLIDNFPQLQIIATGSSSFDLSNKIKEPLTGRVLEYALYPFSLQELSQVYSKLELKSLTDRFLVYGMYPRAVFGSFPAEDLLAVADNYLYKDILEYNLIKKPDILKKIVTILASNVGSEISSAEITNTLDIRKETLDSYITLLEQSFILRPLLPYSSNLRSELTKKKKIIFYDNGIRNAILGNLNQIDKRTDIGALWENFMISQFIIKQSNEVQIVMKKKHNFWRTTDQHQEVDLMVSNFDTISGFEFCYKEETARKKKLPSQFKNYYPEACFEVIHRGNFLDFLITTI